MNRETDKGKSQQQNLKVTNDVKIPNFKVSHKFNLIAEEGAYMLIIDSKLPLY